MPDLFSAPTGAGTPQALTSGSPEYQEAIVGQAERRLKPRYQQSLDSTRQRFASRGLMDSGLGAQAELGLRQAYLDQLGEVGTQAAIRGADVTEQNRRREQERGWQVEDRNMLEERLRRQADMEESRANNQIWGSLIGGAAGGFGGLAGQALFGALSGSNRQPQAAPAALMLDSPPALPDVQDFDYGPYGGYDPSYMDPYAYPPLFPE